MLNFDFFGLSSNQTLLVAVTSYLMAGSILSTDFMQVNLLFQRVDTSWEMAHGFTPSPLSFT